MTRPADVRRTKIICTIGTRTASYEKLEALTLAGMNVVRLNMSLHADHAGAQQIINWIRTINRKLPYPVAILLDTQGPEIRTGERSEPMNLETGQVVTVSVRPGDVENRSLEVTERSNVLHNFFLTSKCTNRHTATNYFSISNKISLNAETFLCTARC